MNMSKGEQDELPIPLSFKRNSEGQGSDYPCDPFQNNSDSQFQINMQRAAQWPDDDIQGHYAGISFRKGPYMAR